MTKHASGLNLLCVLLTVFGHIRGFKPRAAWAIMLAAALAAMFTLAACQKAAENPAPVRLAPVKADPAETPKVAPEKKEEPPQVRIKREKDGRYTWEISGKDAGKILQVDGRLRKSLVGGVETGKDE